MVEGIDLGRDAKAEGAITRLLDMAGFMHVRRARGWTGLNDMTAYVQDGLSPLTIMLVCCNRQ
jgi:hypothetical protein